MVEQEAQSQNPRKLRMRFGFCCQCWRRSRYDLTVTPHNANGDACGASITLNYCAKHAESAMKAVMPVAEEMELTYESGMVVTYSHRTEDGDV